VTRKEDPPALVRVFLRDLRAPVLRSHKDLNREDYIPGASPVPTAELVNFVDFIDMICNKHEALGMPRAAQRFDVIGWHQRAKSPIAMILVDPDKDMGMIEAEGVPTAFKAYFGSKTQKLWAWRVPVPWPIKEKAER